MSLSLPTLESPAPDFLRQLLAEQSQVTAVERFSAAQDSAVGEDDRTTRPFGPAQAKFYKALLPATPPGPGQQYAFEVDLNACSGCKACVVACHTLNGLDEDESWRRVGTLTIGDATPRLQHVTTACHHCAEPACLTGCPVKAYDKDPLTGIVKHLDDQCIGCKYCTMMCPYEVPTYNVRLGIVRKCDMCQQRLSVGEAPACVQACPSAAIAIRLTDNSQTQFPPTHRLSPGAPLSTITQPSTRYYGVATKKLLSATPQDAFLDRPAESHWPLAGMLVATQAAVGLLLVERAAHYGSILLRHDSHSDSATFATLCLAFVVAAVGLGTAGLHLGQPLRAWRIFLGVRTSWLSREAMLFGQTMGLLLLSIAGYAIAHDSLPFVSTSLVPLASPAVVEGLLMLTLLSGVAAVISSGMIYIVTRRQLWRGSRTLGRFLGSAGCLGCGLLGLLLSYFSGPHLTTAWCLALAASGLAVKLAWEFKLHLSPGSCFESDYDRRSRKLACGPLAGLRTLRITSGCVACMLAALASVSAASTAAPLTMWLAGAAVLLMAIGEVSERLLYFASVVHDRMPGTLP